MSEMWLPPGAGGGGQSPGPATDSHNEPVVDPTKNVDALVAAAVLRLDDLRIATEKFFDARANHQKELAKVRAHYEDRLAIKEAGRLDAIRQVDVAASQQQTRDAEVRAQALAKQVTDAAEAVRVALAAETDPIKKDIADLRRLQYELAGQKQQVVESRATDQDFAPLIAAVASLERVKAQSEGEKMQTSEVRAVSRNTGLWVGIGVAALAIGATMFMGFIAIVVSIAIAFYTSTHHSKVQVVTVPTQTSTTP